MDGPVEFCGLALGGPCDGQMLTASAGQITVPVLEGYSEPDEHGSRAPIFGLAVYRRCFGYWIALGYAGVLT